ncbi:MAG: DUF4239 domain-containing protein [Candidatus Sulfopaludibacter sp.]|nr:DUF4239 domain-containing protein [Candidatus Sulfopaludibacter sp.]
MKLPLVPVLGLGAALGLSAFLRSVGFYDFTAREADGLGMLIQLVGDIYAVLLAFVIFVIWGQFTEVENCVMRECSSLDEISRLSRYLDADSHANIRRALTGYATHVIRSEWDALGDGRPDAQADPIFSKLLTSVVESVPRTDEQRLIQARLIDSAQKAGERRHERVSKSLTRIPPTLAALVKTIAALLLLLVFVYPFRQWSTGACGLVMVAALLFLANLVMVDTDNPLKGIWNVSSAPFGAIR